MVTPTALPTAFVTGQVLTAANQNLLRGAFRVLQIVSGTTATQATFTSSTPATTGCTATITPQYNTSKIMIFASIGGVNKQSSNTGCDLYLYRGSSQVIKTGARVGFDQTANEANSAAAVVYLDSPATTSATTYTIYGASSANSSYALTQHQSAYSVIILCEVSA